MTADCNPTVTTPPETENPPVLVPPPPGRTRLITTPNEDRAVYTANRECDVVTAIKRGLREYLEQVYLDVLGVRVRFERVTEVWGETDEVAKFPGVAVMATEAAEYDASSFTPRLNTTPVVALPGVGEPGHRTFLVKYSEVTVPLVIELHTTSPEERVACSMLLEDALNPVDWMYGFKLQLPHYFNEIAVYEPMRAQQLDSSDTARRRLRPGSISLSAHASVVRPRTLPLLKPLVTVQVEAPNDPPVDGTQPAPGNPAPDPEEGEDWLVMLLGQSNAPGMMLASAVTVYPGISTPDPDIQMFEVSAANAGDPPSLVSSGPRDLAPRIIDHGGAFEIGTGGVELSMMRELKARFPQHRFSCGKWGISGASLPNHFNNPLYPSTGDPAKTRIIDFITARMAGFGATKLLIVWIQGEADNVYDTYLTNMVSFFGDIRTAFPGCLIVVNRTIDANDQQHNVRPAQEAYVALTADTRVHRDDTLPLRDAAHYTDDGYALLGVGLAKTGGDLMEGITYAGPRPKVTGPRVVGNSTQGITGIMPPHVAGDRLFFIVYAIGNNDYVVGAPWVQVPGSPQHDGGSAANARLQVWSLVADQVTMDANGGSMPAPVLGDVASDSSKIGFVMVWDNVDQSTPWDVSKGGFDASAASATIDGDTSLGPNRTVLNICAATIDNAAPQFGDPTNPDLDNILQHYNVSTTTDSGFACTVVTGELPAAGPFADTVIPLVTASETAWLTIVLRPPP